MLPFFRISLIDSKSDNSGNKSLLSISFGSRCDVGGGGADLDGARCDVGGGGAGLDGCR